MIVHDCIQGSTAWLELRSGIPTASEFDRILTPEGKPSKSAEGYLHQLLAERMLGRPLVGVVTTWMDRGSQTEAEAVAYYELMSELDTVRIGFVTNDDGTIGASPDRLVGADGLLEIKVPKESNHVGYLLGSSMAKHRPQVQGQLWITGRQWADVMSYNPEMPHALARIHRDEEYIAKLAAAVGAFALALADATESAYARGWIRDRTAFAAAAGP
jgi:YqaJ-like viral recombinase domain